MITHADANEIITMLPDNDNRRCIKHICAMDQNRASQKKAIREDNEINRIKDKIKDTADGS